MKTKSKTIDFDHMEILCFFFHCAPHDLVEWVPDNKIPFDEQHPFSKLKRANPLT
jgi:hypothetical protein